MRERGYTAEVGHSDTWLRQIIVTDPASGEQVLLDLGQDYRQHPPILITGLGPVIDLPDAAASKARALNDRRAARDYLDLHALLTQPGWTPARLFAALRDNLRPVLTADEFAADLAAAGQQDRGLPRLRPHRHRHHPARRRLHPLGRRNPNPTHRHPLPIDRRLSMVCGHRRRALRLMSASISNHDPTPATKTSPSRKPLQLNGTSTWDIHDRHS